MKIVKYEKKGNEKYKVYLDDGSSFDTYEDVILKYKLLYITDLSYDVLEEVLIDTQEQELYHSCLNYISFRLRCEKEVRDYLFKKGATLEQIDSIVCRLKELKVLDEDVYVQAFIRDKIQFTTMGEYRIIDKLKELGISSSVIDKYSYLFERDIMREKIEKIVDKFYKRHSKKDNFVVRGKAYQHLMNLGYSYDLILEVLNSRK